MRWAIIDTNVYIDDWERGAHAAVVDDICRAYIVRHSSVVLSELRRGARTARARQLTEALGRLAKAPWTPEASDWWEAGRVICSIGDAQHWNRARRRDFQNDALIALTARRHGATIVTSDGEDFDLLGRALRIRVLTVVPDA